MIEAKTNDYLEKEHLGKLMWNAACAKPLLRSLPTALRCTFCGVRFAHAGGVSI